MAIERFGDGQDFYIFEMIDEQAASDQQDGKLVAFRAAYLECAKREPSPIHKERTLQQAWAQLGPDGVNCLVGTREEMELTAALLRGYSENTRGSSRMESAVQTSRVKDEMDVEIIELLSGHELHKLDKRIYLGNVALGLATEIENFLAEAPGADGDALEAGFQKFFDKPQAA